MDRDEIRLAAEKAIKSLRAAHTPDVNRLESRGVHLVAAILAIVGTAVVVLGLGTAIAGMLSKKTPEQEARMTLFLAGVGILIAAKLTCLFDRGRLVGARPIRTALMSDAVAWLALAWVRNDRYAHSIGHAATMGFVFAMAVFAFYWEEAAGSWRFGMQKKLLHSAMRAFLVAAGGGFLVMLVLYDRSSSSRAYYLFVLCVSLAWLGALALAIILWLWGLIELTTRLFRDDGRSSGESSEQ